MKVLLLVDIQNDFCPGGALEVPNGNQVVAVANELMQSGQFDYVIASLDWHPAKHVSFASNHPGKELFSQVNLAYENGTVEQTLWPDHCVENSKGAELHPDIDRSRIDYFVKKGSNPAIDSYSAFFDNNRLQETGLRTLLQDLAKDQGLSLSEIDLVTCGLATDYCVAATVRDARYLNIPTTIAIDGCRAVNLNPGDDLKALREFSELGAHIETSQSILEQAIPKNLGRSYDLAI